jgi:predicted hotdog family 3-hydroxylacyl-ACP dehydratase
MIPDLPHRPPFLFVREIVEADAHGLQIVADFPRDNPYVGDGPVPRTLVVEALAQGMAAHARLSGKARDERGVLAMVKKVRFMASIDAGERVVVQVAFKRAFGKLLYYSCSAITAGAARHGTQLVCEGDVVAAVVS